MVICLAYLSTRFGAIWRSEDSPASGLVKMALFLLPGQVVVIALVPVTKHTVEVDNVEVVVATKKSLPARLRNTGATELLKIRTLWDCLEIEQISVLINIKFSVYYYYIRFRMDNVFLQVLRSVKNDISGYLNIHI